MSSASYWVIRMHMETQDNFGCLLWALPYKNMQVLGLVVVEKEFDDSCVVVCVCQATLSEIEHPEI